MLDNPAQKYRSFPKVPLRGRKWPERIIEHPPIWLSTDLRDGNQALVEPMSIEQKIEFFDLLVALADNAGRVLNRDRLMDLVKGEEFDAFDRSIDVHVSRIRSAIEDDPKHPRRIITVRGAGYVFARRQDEEK